MADSKPVEAAAIPAIVQRCHICQEPLRQGDILQAYVEEANEESTALQIGFVHHRCVPDGPS